MHPIRVSQRPWSRRVNRKPQLHPEWAHLPVELYGRIVDFVAQRNAVGRNTLAVLSRVSKSMQVEAERALYHSVFLHPVKTRSLCEIIINHERFWRLVKKCEVFLILGTSQYRLPGESDLIQLSQNLLAVLRQFGRLRDLEVQNLPGTAKFKIGAALRLGSFHLKTFRCSDPFDPDLQNFLTTHPTIEELYVTASRIAGNSGRLSDYALQNSELRRPTLKADPKALLGLETLHVLTSRAAELLVANRPVIRLDIARWDGTCCLSKLVNRLARSSGPFRSLIVRDGFEVDADDLNTIASRLPELNFLGECIFVDKFENILRELAGFQKLQTIVVGHRSFMVYSSNACHGIDAAATLITQKNMECHMVRALSAVCRSLTRVVFNFPTARCWERRGRHWAAIGDWNEEACEGLWRSS